MTSPREAAPRVREPTTVEWTGISFVYWVVFMGALAPGNVSHILADGGVPPWGPLVVRLVGAGALGSLVPLLLLELRRRAPLSGTGARRNIWLHMGAILALAAMLIVVSCFLVAWFVDREPLPPQGELARQLVANWALLVLCITLFHIAMQTVSLLLRRSPGPSYPDHLTISDRGRAVVVSVSEIDWIEAQGNYQALHTRTGVHLYRATSLKIEEKLDPAQFVRIHRRCLVALKQIERLEPLSSGDGLLVMRSGTRLRQARRYRAVLRARLRGS